MNRATETEGGGENGSDRLKKKQTGHGSTENLSVNQPHFLLQDPPLPVSMESYWICCHTLSLLTTPTMYLTVQYCAKLASHDYFVLYS